MDKGEVLAYFLTALLFFALFAIPITTGINIYRFLNPATFWERLAALIISCIASFLIFIVILRILLGLLGAYDY